MRARDLEEIAKKYLEKKSSDLAIEKNGLIIGLSLENNYCVPPIDGGKNPKRLLWDILEKYSENRDVYVKIYLRKLEWSPIETNKMYLRITKESPVTVGAAFERILAEEEFPDLALENPMITAVFPLKGNAPYVLPTLKLKGKKIFHE